MLRTQHGLLLGITALVTASTTLIGCSTDSSSRTETVASAPSAGRLSEASGAGPIGVSPEGVTTRIDVPAQSTEEQYAKACLTAKEWMAAKGGDPQTLVEPYLQGLQASTESGTATFNKTWAELSDAQQSAVIIAVQAAADGGC